MENIVTAPMQMNSLYKSSWEDEFSLSSYIYHRARANRLEKEVAELKKTYLVENDLRRHFKGGLYRRQFNAILTDDAKAGTLVTVYSHISPHPYAYYVRPEKVFEGEVMIEEHGITRTEKRFKEIK